MTNFENPKVVDPTDPGIKLKAVFHRAEASVRGTGSRSFGSANRPFGLIDL